MKSVRIKLICLCLIIASLVSSVSGCLNPDDISEFIYVISIGVDKGKQYKYKITFLMQSASPSAETPQANQIVMTAAEGDNLFEAIDIVEAGMPNRMNFSRMNMLLFSQECAENGSIEDFFRISWSTTKIRTSASLVVCIGKAEDFLEGLNSADNSAFAKLQHILVDYSKATGFINSSTIYEFISATGSKRADPVIALGSIDESIIEKSSNSGGSGGSGGGGSGGEQSPEPSPTKDTTGGVEREGGTKSYFFGSALFDGQKMVGVISGEQTQLLMMAGGKLTGAKFSVVDEKQIKYVVRVANAKKTRVDVDIKEDRIDVVFNIALTVRLDMSVDEEEMSEMRKSGGLLERMAKQIVEYSESGLEHLFADCKRVNCDAFEIGKFVALKFRTVKEWEEFNYKSRYQTVNAVFNVEIDMEDVYVSSYID